MKLSNTINKAYKNSCDYPYELHAIIIHEGDAMSGHYYTYVKDHLENEWYKFNDHRVTKWENSLEEIIDEGIGNGVRSAYFLVYINKNELLGNTKQKSTISYYERFIKGDKDQKIQEDNDEFRNLYNKS